MVITPSMYEGMTIVPCESASSMLEKYYADKNLVTRIRQRSADLRQVVNTALERNYKKYDLQEKQLKIPANVTNTAYTASFSTHTDMTFRTEVPRLRHLIITTIQ